jgi:hypothetical protein
VQIPPGSYTVHYTLGAASLPACQPIADQTITIQPPDGGATAQPPAGCTYKSDAIACTFVSDCTFATNGFTTTSKTTFAYGAVISGTSASKVVKDSDGSVISNCTYEFTYTKK